MHKSQQLVHSWAPSDAGLLLVCSTLYVEYVTAQNAGQRLRKCAARLISLHQHMQTQEARCTLQNPFAPSLCRNAHVRPVASLCTAGPEAALQGHGHVQALQQLGCAHVPPANSANSSIDKKEADEGPVAAQRAHSRLHHLRSFCRAISHFSAMAAVCSRTLACN